MHQNKTLYVSNQQITVHNSVIDDSTHGSSLS